MKLKIILSAILVLGLAGCNALEDHSTSGSTLILTSITGSDLQGGSGSTIAYSDVIQNDGSIVNDIGEATVTAQLLDPNYPDTPTYYQDVIVDQVDVEYFRTDGRNTPGVDVPYAFSEPLNVYVQTGKSAIFGFTLVRHTAKLEAPLLNLVYQPQQVLQLVAKVTFYGKDVGGHRVQPVTGYITIYCANFADYVPPEPEPTS